MDNQEKAFLEVQLKWVKRQIEIHDEIVDKLTKMKTIAEHAASTDITDSEREGLQKKLLIFKGEVICLEHELQQILH